MSVFTSVSVAHPNIAFIKYWGNEDNHLRLPSNGSISMNLAFLETRTEIYINSEIELDEFFLNGKQISGEPQRRIQRFLDIIRKMSGVNHRSTITSKNNFPISAGLASSASGFAALALAASNAYGLQLSEKELSILARKGSGSAARSVPAGFVEWYVGKNDADSFAHTIAPASHWKLIDCIAVIEKEPKATGSTAGHHLAKTSPIQAERVSDCPRRLEVCRKAILEKDFSKLAWIIELDSNLLHAVMMTSSPPLLYWRGASIEIMRKIPDWRREGIPAAYTLDAGSNVHVICESSFKEEVAKRLLEMEGVSDVISSKVGSGAHHLESSKVNNL